MDGNDLRWPGYLGRDYEPASGVLCVGAVHREGNPANRDDGSVAERTDAELVAGAREWLTTGRSPTSDAGYLESLRSSYQQALPTWSRWQRHYRTLVEDYLGLDIRGSESCAPLVFAWQGQSGHDRHNTAPGARRLAEWAPEAAAQIRARMSSAAANGNG